MLREIYINNFVLIDNIRLEFEKGLNVLTGETGAGKSIIIDALGLIMGERIKNDYIKDNTKKAIAEAVFDIKDNIEAREFLLKREFIEEDENIIIVSRQIAPNGRNSVRLNSHNVTLNTLKILSSYLIDLHLQHEHMSILRSDKYLTYVDSFISENEEILNEISTVFLKLENKKRQMEKLLADEQDKLQKIDFLAFQIKEIERAGLQPDEEKQLGELQIRIKNSQKLLQGTNQLLQLLYNGEQFKSAYDLISAAIDTVTDLKEDDYFLSLIVQLDEICYSLQEITTGLSSYRDSLDFEPGLLEKIEDRLHEIHRLKAKYGNDIEEILKFLDAARQELENLNNSQEEKEKLEEQIQLLNKDYFSLASRLTIARKKAAQILQDKVNSELFQLSMPYIKFSVEVKENGTPGRSGINKVEFMFSPNPGEPMRPLSRVASGGEISRFILALKKALAEAYNVPTLIFDEIDVGVGGTALNAMALKLRELSDTHQVILVTHSPQIASCAENHYLIMKHFKNRRTVISVEKLENEKITFEIARMLDGENYSEIAIKHAKEMLNNTRS